MSNINTAAILRGPAIIQWRGATIFHRGNLSVPVEMSTFDIDVEPFGVIQRRADQGSISVEVTPSGRASEISALINRYATARNGDLINIEEYAATVATVTGIVTTTGAHLLATGDEVMLHALIAMPTGLSSSTRYYAHVLSSTTLTLHASVAHADSNTDAVIPTTAGTAVVLDITRALVITTYKGLRIKYYNAGLTKVPELKFTAKDTLLGSATFKIFVRNGADHGSANGRFYELSAGTPDDSGFDPSSIYTDAPLLTWAFTADWTGIPTKEGAKVAINVETADLPSDSFGSDALGRIFKSVDVSVTASPQGVSEAAMMDAMQLHSKVRGDRISAGQLQVATDHYTFAVSDAVMTKCPQNYSSEEQRGGECEWKSQRKFSSGMMEPLYLLTTPALPPI